MDAALRLRSTLLGTRRLRSHALLVAALALAAFIASLGGYVGGLYEPTGGIVLVPFWAAVVAVAGGAVAGVARTGLPSALLFAGAAMLGFGVDDAFIGGRTVAESVSYLSQPGVLGALGVLAALFGVVGFLAGTAAWGAWKLGRRGVA